MLVHEADLNKGGLPLAAVREECPGELRGFIFERERSFHTYVDARLIISRGMKRMKWPPPLHLRARTPFRSVIISCLQACYQVAASDAVPGGVAPPHRPGASRRLPRPPGQLHFISSPPRHLPSSASSHIAPTSLRLCSHHLSDSQTASHIAFTSYSRWRTLATSPCRPWRRRKSLSALSRQQLDVGAGRNCSNRTRTVTASNRTRTASNPDQVDVGALTR